MKDEVWPTCHHERGGRAGVSEGSLAIERTERKRRRNCIALAFAHRIFVFRDPSLTPNRAPSLRMTRLRRPRRALQRYTLPMPLVRVTLRKGKSPEYIRDLGQAIHDALVAQANVPIDDRFQIFHEVDDDRIFAHPSYAGVNRSSDL